jgi:hypothetical protein
MPKPLEREEGRFLCGLSRWVNARMMASGLDEEKLLRAVSKPATAWERLDRLAIRSVVEQNM